MRRTSDVLTKTWSASTQETIEHLLGVRLAHAGAPSSASEPPTALPGALGLPTAPQTLIDHRYLCSNNCALAVIELEEAVRTLVPSC